MPDRGKRMGQLNFKVPSEYHGATVKGFLRGYCGMSARLLIRLKREERGILVNGKPVWVVHCLQAGDRVELILPEDRNHTESSGLSVPVAWEDSHLIFFEKPPGMPVHPSPGHANDTLANIARSYAEQKGEHWAFRPINRLDRDTSGLVAVAKNAYCASQLAGDHLQKEYFAVCQGILTGSGTIDAPIRVKKGHTIQREVGEGGVKAVTHWQALGCGHGHTLLRIHLETGRTHQIRVHFSHLGMPLAGDDMYGGSRKWISRQALHCGWIQGMHPVAREPFYVAQKFPQDFQTLCRQIETVVREEDKPFLSRFWDMI